MTIGQLDIISAYLNGNLNEEVYMEIPNLAHECLKDIADGNRETREIQEAARKMLHCLKNGKGKVCRLKAIYGLKQAARQWNEKLNEILEQIGHQQ